MTMSHELDIGALCGRLTLNARGRPLLEFNGQQVLLSKFSEHPRWEFHPDADEYLQVIEGRLDVVLLHESATEEFTLEPGGICVVPKGVWHSPIPRGPVTLLSIGGYRGTRVSEAEDPRK
jgi:mannose-6-phosphate isomerase-like protein (cupin superfamily)